MRPPGGVLAPGESIIATGNLLVLADSPWVWWFSVYAAPVYVRVHHCFSMSSTVFDNVFALQSSSLWSIRRIMRNQLNKRVRSSSRSWVWKWNKEQILYLSWYVFEIPCNWCLISDLHCNPFFLISCLTVQSGEPVIKYLQSLFVLFYLCLCCILETFKLCLSVRKTFLYYMRRN